MMIYESRDIENERALETAKRICVAARTAPKTKGIDRVHTMILTGAEQEAIVAAMKEIGEKQDRPSFLRDAKNVELSQAVVLIGIEEGSNGLNAACQLCHFGDCAKRVQANATCVFNMIDLGIAVGSAVAMAADDRVDNRVMYSVGKAALEMGLFPEKVTVVMGIPLSVSGKSPYFDRK